MKTVAVLLVVVAVAQAGLLANITSTLTSLADKAKTILAKELAAQTPTQLLGLYKALCPNTVYPYSDDVAAQNLADAVQRMLANPVTTISKGLTCQSIFSYDDYVSIFLAAKPPTEIERSNATVPARRRRAALPAAVDWRTSGYVSAVQNQGQCGSCWSYSANGAMEGAIKKKTGKLPNLSEQNLVDCVTASSGCDGGWMTEAYDYVKSNGGVAAETSYPYLATKQASCKYVASTSAGTVTSYDYTIENDEVDLATKVATIGPVATAIDASYIQNYKSGIVTCPNFTGLNHGVLIVGYGANSTSGEKWWIVKNSWGTSWGIQGYMHIAKDKGNQCGIASAANYVIA